MAPGAARRCHMKPKSPQSTLPSTTFSSLNCSASWGGEQRGRLRVLDEVRQLVGVWLHQPALLDADHPIAAGQHVGSWLTSSRVGPGLKASPCASTWAATTGSSADKGLSSSRISARA